MKKKWLVYAAVTAMVCAGFSVNVAARAIPENEQYSDGEYYYDPDTGEYMESNDAGFDYSEIWERGDYDYIDANGNPGYITAPAGQGIENPPEEPYYYVDDNGDLWHFDGYAHNYIGVATDSYTEAYNQREAEKNTGTSTGEQSGASSTDYSYYSEEEDDQTQVMDSEIIDSEADIAIEDHTYLSFPLTDDLKVLNFQVVDQKSYQEILGNKDGSVRVYIYRSKDGMLGKKNMKEDTFLPGIFKNNDEIQRSETSWNSYPCTRISYKTSLSEKEMNLEALFVYTDTDCHCIVVLNAVDGGQDGYAEAIFGKMTLSETKAFAGTKTVTSDDGVNIRTAPSTEAEAVGYLSDGDTIDVYEYTLNGWYQVYTVSEGTGKTVAGFITGELLK